MVNTLWVVALSVLGAGVIAIELGVSSAITELLAGILVKNVLDFRPDSFITVIGNLGLLTLMYVAGLEIDFDQIERRSRESITIGLSSFAAPFILVSLFAYYQMGLNGHQSMLLGVALSTTSMAIVYPQLLANGVLTEKTRGILSAAMVTDLASMLVFSLLFTRFTLAIFLPVIGLIVLTYFVPFIGRRVFARFEGNPVEFEFRVILFLIVSLGIVSEHAGVEAALVAFVAGMVTSELVVNHADLQNKLQSLVFGFLAPIFFLWVGLTVDLHSLSSNMHSVMLLFTLCYAAKYVGTYLPSKRFFPDDARRMGFLFNARLSLGLVAALFGLNEGILSTELYGIVVGCIIVSSIVSSILLRSKKDVWNGG